MDLEQKEGILSQENTDSKKKSLFKEHKFMLLASLFIVLATLFVTLVPKNSVQNRASLKPIITPPLVIITATPSPEPSIWASSSAILKMEKDTRDLQNILNNTDFQDPVLSLPNIETSFSLTN